jgi:protein involved in polysaccharide export with SLBB domain
MNSFFFYCRTVLTAYLLSFFTIAPVIAQTSPDPRKQPGFQNSNVSDLSKNEDGKFPNVSPTSPLSNKALSGQEYTHINVHVLGDVENPGLYTVEISERLSNALSFASPKRSSLRIVQLRTPGQGTRSIDLYKYYFQGDLGNNPFLKENDVIFVPQHKGIVRIEGPVARPGLYELANEKNLDDVTRLAGGMTSATSNIHPVKVIRFSEAGKKFVLNVSNTRRDLRNFKIMKGDIIIIPDIVNNPSKFDYTVESIPGENLFYPTSTPNVFVMGQVGLAGSFPYKTQLRIKDYLASASPTPQAKMDTVSLIRNGKRMTARFDEKPIPGDILLVKSKLSVGTIVAALSTTLTLALTTLLLRDQLKN